MPIIPGCASGRRARGWAPRGGRPSAPRAAGPRGTSAPSRAPRPAARTTGSGSPAGRPRAADDREPVLEAHVQQREPDGAVVLRLRHDDHGAAVLATARDEHLPLDRDGVLRAAEEPGALRARGDVERDATAVDDRHRHLVALRIAVELVADPTGDLRHGGIDVGQRAQRLVAEPVACRPGRQHGLHERRLQQGLVAARDPDRDRLGLVLDGVDRTGELLDALRQRRGEVVDDHRGGADAAELGLVGVQGRDAEGVAVRRRRAAPPCSPRGCRRRRRCAVRRRSGSPRPRGPAAATCSSWSPSAGACSPTASSMAARASRSGVAWASMASAAS